MSRSTAILAMAAAAAAQPGCSSDQDAVISHADPVPKGRVSSSIPDGAQLSRPLRWTVRVTGVPPSDVRSLRFLIDGKVADVDRQVPYEYAGRGHLLIPGVLGRGSHTFAVDARLRGGRRLTGASTATSLTERKAP